MIDHFEGEYWFLSNYYPCKVTFDGYTYESAEAAYHAQKTFNKEYKKQYTTMTADESRHFSRTIPVDFPDWDKYKVQVMYKIVLNKFTQNDDLKNDLLKTSGQQLQEEGWWQDKFWGVYQGEGENILGKILMKIREELKNE